MMCTLLTNIASERNISYKNCLQEYAQASHSPLPTYKTERSAQGFVATVAVRQLEGDAQYFRGKVQGTIKAAEQDSARVACEQLKIIT